MMSNFKKRVFVFGSNLAGRHGAGAAKYALKHHSAQYGQGVGLQGRSYAIPTKDSQLKSLPLDTIQGYCIEFLHFAAHHPDCLFDLTPIGCGLAGYKRSQIKPFFEHKTDNVIFTKEWSEEDE